MITDKMANAICTSFYSGVAASWTHFGIVFALEPMDPKSCSGCLQMYSGDEEESDKFEIYSAERSGNMLVLRSGDGFQFAFEIPDPQHLREVIR